MHGNFVTLAEPSLSKMKHLETPDFKVGNSICRRDLDTRQAVDKLLHMAERKTHQPVSLRYVSYRLYYPKTYTCLGVETGCRWRRHAFNFAFNVSIGVVRQCLNAPWLSEQRGGAQPHRELCFWGGFLQFI